MLKLIYGFLFMLVATVWMQPVTTAQELTVITENNPEASFSCGQDVCGFNVEVVKEIMKRLGLKTKIEILPWKRGYQNLLTMPNTILFSTTYTKERSKKFQWCGPLSVLRYSFIKSGGSNIIIKNMADAKKLRIGTYANDVREDILIKAGFNPTQFSHFYGTEANMKNLKLLLLGRIDLWFTDFMTADIEFDRLKKNRRKDDSYLKLKIKERTHKNPFEIAYKTTPYYLYAAISKNTPSDVVENWQATLDQIKADGTYLEIMRKYKYSKYWMTFDHPAIK